MAEDPTGGSPLAALGARIAAARERHRPATSRRKEFTVGSIAWRMVVELVVGVLVGGAMGWGLDALFGTLPLFLIVMGLLGFAAGVRVMLRSARELGGVGKDDAVQDGGRE